MVDVCGFGIVVYTTVIELLVVEGYLLELVLKLLLLLVLVAHILEQKQ